MVIQRNTFVVVLLLSFLHPILTASEKKSSTPISIPLKNVIASLAIDFGCNLIPQKTLLTNTMGLFTYLNNAAEEATTLFRVFIKDELVGSAALTCSRTTDPFTKKFYLETIIIKKSFQNLGIGSFLMNQFLDFAQKTALTKKINILFFLESADIESYPEWSDKKNSSFLQKRSRFYRKCGLRQKQFFDELDLAVRDYNDIPVTFGIIFAGAPTHPIPKKLNHFKVIDQNSLKHIQKNTALLPLYKRMQTYLFNILSTDNPAEKLLPSFEALYSFSNGYKKASLFRITPRIKLITKKMEHYDVSFGTFEKSTNGWETKSIGWMEKENDAYNIFFKKSKKLFTNQIKLLPKKDEA